MLLPMLPNMTEPDFTTMMSLVSFTISCQIRSLLRTTMAARLAYCLGSTGVLPARARAILAVMALISSNISTPRMKDCSNTFR